MSFTIVIPADLEWIIRMVRDLISLIRKAYPEAGITTAEFKMEGDDDGQEE